MEALEAWLREQRRLRLVEVLVRRALRVLVLVFAAAVALRVLGVVPGLGGSALLLSAALLLVALSPILRPVRVGSLGLDRELDARDALATCLDAREPGAKSRPSLELVARSLGPLIGSGRTRSRARRRIRRLGRSLFRLLLLLLLAILILPGGRASSGQGIKQGVGSGASPAAGAGASTASGGSVDRQPDRSGESGPPEEGRPEAPEDAQPPTRSRDRGDRVVPLVVFPRFDASEGRSERSAPRIQRSPLGSSEQGRGKAARPGTPGEDVAIEEWRRQSERTMARGLLPSWEARWLALYGDCLGRRGTKRR